MRLPLWATIPLISLLVAGAIVLMIRRLITVAIEESYSPSDYSESVSEAQKENILILQPNVENRVIRWQNSEYFIREAWIERSNRIQYQLLLFRQVVPTGTGYRLKLKVTSANGSSLPWPPFETETVCNGTITITTYRGDTWFAENISPPFSKILSCEIRKDRD